MPTRYDEIVFRASALPEPSGATKSAGFDAKHGTMQGKKKDEFR